MKRLFLAFLLLSPGLALTQTPPPAPATVADVLAGTATYKFISPAAAAGAGLSSPTNGVSATAVTNIVNAIAGGVLNSNSLYAVFATNAGAAVNATNVYYGGTVTTTNVLTKIASDARTNANAFMGYGGLQLSTAVYGQSATGNYNYRNGVEFLDNGWNGSPLPPTDGSTVLNGFMRSYWNWGGAADAPVLHIADKGSIRIEANYGDPAYFGEAYVALGNEDGNPKVRINYVSASTTNNGDLGYSLPLTFDARGKISGVNQTAQPGFMGRWAGPAGGAGPYEGLYQGELSFYSRVPVPDTNYPTYGNNFPTSGVEVGRMRTNGWQFFGPVNYQQTSRSLFGTNVVLDFNAGSAQAIALASGITNRFSTVNVDAYAGTTNLEPRFFRITSGGLDTPIIWPAWNAGSENGIAPLPSILPATNALFLRLSGWGTGDTNIIADWRMSPDTAFAYDSDAAAFFTAASITDVYQKGAVDYLVKALKAANEWTNMVALYPFIGGASNQHALNLKNPATYPITFTSSGVTHNGNGITGNGSSGYGSIPIDWATAIPQSVTNFHLAVYNRTTTPTDGGAFIGGRNGSSVGAGLTRESASAGVRGAMNTLGPNAIVNLSTDLTGPLVLTRANNFNNFDVGTRLGVTTTTSDAVTSFSPNPYILAYNFNGSASAYSTANLSFASLGFGFTAAQLTNFMNIVANYNAARSGAALGWAYRYVGTHVGDGSGLTNLPSGGSTTITNTTSAAGVVVGGSGSFGIGTNLTSVAGGTNQFWVAASPPNEKYTNLFGNTDGISGAYRVFTVGTNVGNNVQISDGVSSFPQGVWIDAGAQDYFIGKVNVGVERGSFSLSSGAVSNLISTATITASNATVLGTLRTGTIVTPSLLATNLYTLLTNKLLSTDGDGKISGLWNAPSNSAATDKIIKWTSATTTAFVDANSGGTSLTNAYLFNLSAYTNTGTVNITNFQSSVVSTGMAVNATLGIITNVDAGVYEIAGTIVYNAPRNGGGGLRLFTNGVASYVMGEQYSTTTGGPTMYGVISLPANCMLTIQPITGGAIPGYGAGTAWSVKRIQ